MFKKITSCLLAAILLILPLASCGEAPPVGDSKLKVITTIFPLYDWARQIVGDSGSVEYKMLLTSGVDLHSYQPSVQDVAEIAECDVFIYVGGASDDWVPGLLASAKNDKLVAINLIDVLGEAVKQEELVEGMEDEHDEEPDGEHEEDELDEHIWLSLRSAQQACEYITARLCELDAENATAYRANADAYTAALAELDGRYAAALAAAGGKTLLFGDRFPFRYLADDYGLKYYAAFAGCSAETEASFETIAFLARKVDELSLNTVLVLEGSSGALARTIIDSTGSKNQQLLAMDSMQSITASQAEHASYLEIMEANLTHLQKALG